MKIFVSGNFNILHPGHIRLLRYAKRLGSKLIVGVNSDMLSKENIFINENLRIKNIKALNFVNSVVLVKDLKKTLFQIKPNIIVKGKEFRNSKNQESKYLKNLKAKLVFGSGSTNYSTDQLLKKEIKLNNMSFEIPNDFITRHKIKKEKIIKHINNFKKLRVAVIGDIIIDEYIDNNVLGSSNEEPCMVISPFDSKKYIGGAGIVACHSRSLGANTKILSVIGSDKNRKNVLSNLKKFKVKFEINIDNTRPTTLKQRFKIENRSVIKISHLSQDPISLKDQKFIFENIKKDIKNLDLIILSDFNYGCLPQALVKKIIHLAKKNKVFISADSQSSSQIGDISRFQNVNLITPTEKEARISVKSNTDGLVVLTEKLQKISGSKNLILTLGGDGILIKIKKRDKINHIHTDKIPAINKYPRDVAGAGDSLLVVTSLMLASGSTIWEASLAGSLFAALQSNSVGNKPIKQEDFLDLVSGLQNL